MVNYQPKNGNEEYKEFEPCTKRDYEVELLMKEPSYRNRHIQALANNS